MSFLKDAVFFNITITLSRSEQARLIRSLRDIPVYPTLRTVGNNM